MTGSSSTLGSPGRVGGSGGPQPRRRGGSRTPGAAGRRRGTRVAAWRCAWCSPRTTSWCAQGTSALLSELDEIELVDGRRGPGRAARGGRASTARRRAHRHPDAADLHDRGHRRGASGSAPSTRAPGSWCCRSTSRRTTRSSCSRTASRGWGTCSRSGCRRSTSCVRALRRGVPRRLGPRPEGRRGAARPPVRPTRRRRCSGSPSASARCCGEMATGLQQRGDRQDAVHERAGGGEAHHQRLPEARAERGGRGQPPGRRRCSPTSRPGRPTPAP